MVWDDGAEEVLYLQRYGNGREEVNRYSISEDDTCPNRKGVWKNVIGFIIGFLAAAAILRLLGCW